jgi:hypothetical protein
MARDGYPGQGQDRMAVDMLVWPPDKENAKVKLSLELG